MDPTIGCVYFLQGRDTRRIKIGYSKDIVPTRRLKELLTGCSESVNLIGFVPGTCRMEGAIHRMFSADRFVREWFQPSNRLVAFIQKILSYSETHYGIGLQSLNWHKIMGCDILQFEVWRSLHIPRTPRASNPPSPKAPPEEIVNAKESLQKRCPYLKVD